MQNLGSLIVFWKVVKATAGTIDTKNVIHFSQNSKNPKFIFETPDSFFPDVLYGVVYCIRCSLAGNSEENQGNNACVRGLAGMYPFIQILGEWPDLIKRGSKGYQKPVWSENGVYIKIV